MQKRILVDSITLERNQKLECGDVIIMSDNGTYIVTQVGNDELMLISLKSANRYTEGKFTRFSTLADLVRIFGSELKDATIVKKGTYRLTLEH